MAPPERGSTHPITAYYSFIESYFLFLSHFSPKVLFWDKWKRSLVQSRFTWKEVIEMGDAATADYDISIYLQLLSSR